VPPVSDLHKHLKASFPHAYAENLEKPFQLQSYKVASAEAFTENAS
jgi:hypothetical protein